MQLKRTFLGIALATLLLTTACPAWYNDVVSIAETTINIIAVIDPAVLPIVTMVEGVFNAIEAASKTYAADIAANSPNAPTDLQKLTAAVEAADSNVAQFEAAFKVSNQATDAKIAAIVNLIVQAMVNIENDLPAPAVSARMSLRVRRTTGTPNKWKGSDFKKQYNSIIAGDSRFRPMK
jgi:hypothetical protein